MNEEGFYMYGIIAASQRQEFGSIGIGKRGDMVYTLPYQNLAAIVSRSPIIEYPVTRANTIAHIKVLEKVMEEYSILPIRFCTIANSEDDIIEKALKAHYEEFVTLLSTIEGKIELGVRVRWTDINTIFAEVVAENQDIQKMRERLLSEESEERKYAYKIQIGQRVKEALDEKKQSEADDLLSALLELSLHHKENPISGDAEIVNAAFLVSKEKEKEFDRKIQELGQQYGGRKRIKYVGPVAPYNFVEAAIN